MESRYTFFAILTARLDLGPCHLGHYQINPQRKPDSVFRHHCWLRSGEQGDFETTLWAVAPATAADLAEWSGHHSADEQGDLIVLTDPHGNILLHDYVTPAEAKRLMAQATHSTNLKVVGVRGPMEFIAPIGVSRRGMFEVITSRGGRRRRDQE